MERRIRKFETPQALADGLAVKLREEINNKYKIKENFYLSLSGGSTPRILFKILAEPPFAKDIKWETVHLFWGDERCVPPDDAESNYGMTKNLLLDKITIPDGNVHRIKGEVNPEEESLRYADEVKNYVPVKRGLPGFDCILLGMGEDGHTASLLPGQKLYAVAQGICGVAEKSIPSKDEISIQKRISLTREVICNSEQIIFLVTGTKKSKPLSEIINQVPSDKNYPASRINNFRDISEWWIDKEAALYL